MIYMQTYMMETEQANLSEAAMGTEAHNEEIPAPQMNPDLSLFPLFSSRSALLTSDVQLHRYCKTSSFTTDDVILLESMERNSNHLISGQPTEPVEDTMCADPEPCLSHEGVIEEPIMMKSLATTKAFFWRPSESKKYTYKVFMYTGDEFIRKGFLTLVNSDNESSDKTRVKRGKKEIIFEVSLTEDLGDIVQVKLEMRSSPWFCKQIKVKAPSGKLFEFPFYRWINGSEAIIREGRARLPQDETGFLKKHRREELESRLKTFRWITWDPNFPQIIDSKLCDLHVDVRFDEEKNKHFTWNFVKVFSGNFVDAIKGFIQPWEDMHNFEQILKNYCLDNTLLENVMQDWNTDYMFGYQLLNGCNPVMISKCVKLPDIFPVTHKMVESFLQRGLTLEEELMAGNIYIANYEILEGLQANKSSRNTQYYVTAPICLLYNDRLNNIVPIAIQLSQTKGEMKPIFLPNDNEYDWMLAKMWVKCADFNVHQLITHLLKTHLISEVFEVAIHRQLSEVHPVYKLLMPHIRFTVAINTEARKFLISEYGIFKQISNISGDGVGELMKRAMEVLTLESLCLPEDIKARGMEDAPNYYYRDDGMKVWETINHFVSDVVEIYYHSDEAVVKDVEIQEFVKDVSLFGLRDQTDKFPKSLNSRVELTKYLTAVIFTSSAQHAAVNFGQFDWYGWIPNSPSTMRKPPPQQKGIVDLAYIMETLPDRNCSSLVLGTVWSLSRFQENERFLGMYPDMYFTEKPAKEAINTFHGKLDDLTDQIKNRNKTIKMPYCYLSPDQIPNSVAI